MDGCWGLLGWLLLVSMDHSLIIYCNIYNKQSADWRFLCDSTSWNTNQHHGTPLGQLASHDLNEARTRFCLKKHRKRTVTQDDPQKIHHSVRIWFIIAMAMAKPVGCEYVVRWTILEDHGRPLPTVIPLYLPIWWVWYPYPSFMS